MKFNFGTGIIIFLALFMGGLLSFVIFAYRQDINLVHDNYYEKGVDHSQQMAKTERSMVYNDIIEVTDEGKVINIVFPETLAPAIQNGQVTFFRPSDHLKDFTKPLTFTGSTHSEPKDKLIPGRYIVKIEWQFNNLDFEVDKTVHIK